MGNVGVYDEQGKKDFLQDAGIDPLLSEPFESRHVVFRPSPHHRVMEAGCVYDVDKWGRTGSKNRLRVNVQLTRLRSKAPEKVHISSNVCISFLPASFRTFTMPPLSGWRVCFPYPFKITTARGNDYSKR